jgi:hypothetical protein
MPAPKQPGKPRQRFTRTFTPKRAGRVAEAEALSVPALDKYVRAVNQLFAQFGGEQEILAEAVTKRSVFSKANIVGAGVGYKNGDHSAGLAVQVFVVKKLLPGQLDPSLAVPKSVTVDSDQLPTDVIETGEIVALPNAYPFDVINAQAVGVYTGRERPAPGGCSVGHPKVTAGTFGCLVNRNNGLYILSNNHVLGAVNRARVGDPIYQPGAVDGGTDADTIAQIDSLDDVVEIDFSAGAVNEVDAALALTNTDDTSPQMEGGLAIDDPTPLDPSVGMNVQKVGRTTGLTTGQVLSLSARVRVNYDNQFGQFQNQIAIRGTGGSAFSQPGDSGSLVLSTGTVQPVALLFAGSDQTTFATPIRTVMNAFGGFDVIATFSS